MYIILYSYNIKVTWPIILGEDIHEYICHACYSILLNIFDEGSWN